MSDIKICTDENTAKHQDVVICAEEQTPKPQDIKICEDDGRLDPCSTIAQVIISGDSDCNVGDIYTASGGTGSYTYSFDSGSINPSTGEILTITDCGSPGDPRGGVVSVNDGCSISSLEVRLTGGEWVIISDPPRGTYFWGVNGTSCAVKFADAHVCAQGFQITINGATRIREAWQCIDGRDDSELCPIDTPVSSAIADCSLCTTSVYTIPIQNGFRTEEWQCP